MMIREGLFCDLDNTIIFSYRHDIGERVLVETIDGKEQAYMTRRGYELLQSIPRESFIPLTSRREEQYRRITFFRDGRIPKYALIDNGGILLVDGEYDESWLEESRIQVAGDEKKLERLEKDFSSLASIKIQDGLIMFFKTETAGDEILNAAEQEDLIAFRYRNKVYACSKSLNKGNAIRRFKNRFALDYIVSAGDSEIDESMIYESDLSYMSDGLKKKNWNDKRVIYLNSVKIAENVFGR